MALLFADSFDHYATANMLDKWTTTNGGSIVAAVGRNGTACYQNTGNFQYAKKTLPTNKTTLILGVGVNLQRRAGTDIPLLSFHDGITAQVDVRVVGSNNSGTGRLIITRNGTTIGTGTTILSIGTYYYIELKVTINSTTGSAVLRINNAVEITLTGVNTQATANAFIDSFAIGLLMNPENNNAANANYDDLYVCDTLGANNNDFLGDIRVEFIKPNAAGALAGWTPTPATNNYSRVNEVPYDSDTSYVSTTVAATRDSYAHGALAPTAASIKGVQTIIVARKDDAGSRIISPMIRQAGVNYDIGAQANVGVAYGLFTSIQELNPATAAAFTLAEINADEIGIDLIS